MRRAGLSRWGGCWEPSALDQEEDLRWRQVKKAQEGLDTEGYDEDPAILVVAAMLVEMVLVETVRKEERKILVMVVVEQGTWFSRSKTKLLSL